MMMTLAQVSTATLDQLTDELAAAGWDSTQTDVHDAREAVVRLMHETCGPFDLHDETNDVIGEATVEQAVASVLAGPEGWINSRGTCCYVAE